MTREEIIEKYPILTWVQDRNGKLRRSGSTFTTNLCPVTPHGDNHLCVSLNQSKEVWHCNDCDKGGSVIDWVMVEKGVDIKTAIQELGGDTTWSASTDGLSENTAKSRQAPVSNSSPKVQPSGEELKEVCTYDYTDETGRLVYQVVRYEPKTFKQRQPKGEDWQWNLEGVTRVLYSLPRVLRAQAVILTEGEKDADNLSNLGFVTTTNAGGSSSWLEAYADTLKGKDIICFPDNDSAGERHFRDIVATLKDRANSVKRVVVPKEFKDVSDWLASIPEDQRGRTIIEAIERTLHTIDPLPLYTASEMEEQYREFVRELPKKSFSMARFCPKFHKITKNLIPGELVMIMGDTGAGKTAVMQSIARSANPLPTLFFELELPASLMFQRQMQMESGCTEEEIVHDYESGDESLVSKFKGMQHILTCPQSGITMDTIEKYIIRSELKFGAHPVLVFVDYMSLVRKENSKSRYEAMASAAEQAKVIAKRTNTIMFIGSQVARPEGNRKMITDVQLHHAKGAGELENSANLVIGISQNDERNKILMKVLKNTRGKAGSVIEADFDGAKMQITESVGEYRPYAQ